MRRGNDKRDKDEVRKDAAVRRRAVRAGTSGGARGDASAAAGRSPRTAASRSGDPGRRSGNARAERRPGPGRGAQAARAGSGNSAEKRAPGGPRPARGTVNVGTDRADRLKKSVPLDENRAKTRRTRQNGLWTRASRISPRTVIVMMILLLFIACASGPTLRNIEANSRLGAKEAELKQQQSTTTALERDLKKAKSMRYVEEEARKQRLVRPGELLYLVTSDDDSSPIEYRVKSLQSMEEAWERVRSMLNCSYTPPGRTD